MSEWVNRKNAPAGNDSENTQKKKYFFPFCAQIKNEEKYFYIEREKCKIIIINE